MDKPHARIIDRDEAVREMIELAISLYLNDRSWASAITLARAAQQYLHEKLRTLGMEPTLAIVHNQIRDVEGIEISFSDFRDHQTGYANLLKHSRDANEPSTLTIKANRVERGIELAIADYNQAFG